MDNIPFKNKDIMKLDEKFGNGRGKKKTVQVEYTIDGQNVPFEGTVKEGPRKAVMKVSNPEYGSVRTVERFDKHGNLTKQKIVDRDSTGKLLQVTTGKVDEKGNIHDKTKYPAPRKPRG